jgi:hypothetical protein
MSVKIILSEFFDELVLFKGINPEFTLPPIYH